jgi:hypothetical protein
MITHLLISLIDRITLATPFFFIEAYAHAHAVWSTHTSMSFNKLITPLHLIGWLGLGCLFVPQG